MGWRSPSPSSLSSLRRSLRRFASSRSPPIHEALSGGVAESLAYRRSMLRPPPTARASYIPWNSCNFIGMLVAPVRRIKWSDPRVLGAYTFLEVKPPSSIDPATSYSSFLILLSMWGKLAEISIRYLNPKDIVYVSGPLDSYEKVNEEGDCRVTYKVIVSDLNYVRYDDQNQTPLKDVGLRHQESARPSSNAADHEEKIRERLHLWQLFFSSPHEWWDNRQSKPSSMHPDFKHKDTRESLWINPDDPPWVRKQLDLYDSKMVGTCRKNIGGWSAIDEWKIQDFK